MHSHGAQETFYRTSIRNWFRLPPWTAVKYQMSWQPPVRIPYIFDPLPFTYSLAIVCPPWIDLVSFERDSVSEITDERCSLCHSRLRTLTEILIVKLTAIPIRRGLVLFSAPDRFHVIYNDIGPIRISQRLCFITLAVLSSSTRGPGISDSPTVDVSWTACEQVSPEPLFLFPEIMHSGPMYRERLGFWISVTFGVFDMSFMWIRERLMSHHIEIVFTDY